MSECEQDCVDMVETLKTDVEQPHLKWPGTYRLMPYTVCKWYMSEGTVAWNYYIFPTLERIKDKSKAEALWLDGRKCSLGSLIVHDYHETEWCDDIWFHGGCTFYERKRGLEGGPRRVVKIGCDYGHVYDTSPRIDRALRDVQKTIDSFHNWCGVYLCRCMGCGTYFEPGTGETNQQGKETRCGGDSKWCHYDTGGDNE